jgi:hypothetical protein
MTAAAPRRDIVPERDESATMQRSGTSGALADTTYNGGRIAPSRGFKSGSGVNPSPAAMWRRQPMSVSDTDNLVAAIFAASMCGNKKIADPEEYFQVHEMFIEIMKARRKTKKAPLKITAKMLASMGASGKRRT